MGYLDAGNYIVITGLIGYGFNASIKLAAWTENLFDFHNIRGWWEHSEVWYGFMQDVAIALVILNMTVGG
jgi:hypothetical protein